jgi:competence protein ComEA
MGEKSSGAEIPIFNLEKISAILSQYKFPLILGGVGIILFILAISFVVKSQTENKDVLFSTESSGSANMTIKIDIQGGVMTAGVYNLKEGSRMADALSAAGGLSADADREYLAKYLNRAAKLTDGQKIYIPSVGDATGGQSLSNSSTSLGSIPGQKTINLNTASQAELEALPGVGPATAGKIISGRPYQTIEDLKNKKVVGSALFEKIKDLISVF